MLVNLSRKRASIRRRDEDEDEEPYECGTRVQVKYNGKSVFYSGVVADISPSGGYSIIYNNGKSEKGVHVKLVRLPVCDNLVALDDITMPIVNEGNSILF